MVTARTIVFRPVAALTLIFWSAVLLVRPWGDFPFDDDWAYGETVRYWMSEGVLRVSSWTPLTLLAHAAWGRLFCALFGFSYGSLRFSTLALAWLGLLVFHRSLLRLGASAPAAFAGALVLLFNPLYFRLSLSYMTDVAALAWMLMAAHAFLIAELDEKPAWAWIGSALSGVAYLVRQTGACIALGAAVWLLWRGRRSPRGLLRTLAGLLVALLIHAWWLRSHGVNVVFREYALRDTWANLSGGWDALGRGVERVEGAAVHLALFLSPLFLAGTIGLGALSRRRLALLAAAAATLGGAWWFHLAPVTGNILNPFGLGVCSMPGCAFKAAGPFGVPAFWAVAGALAVAGGAVALCGFGSPSAPVGLFASGFLAAFLLSLAGGVYFDRYFLVLLPAVIAAWAATCRVHWLRLAPGLAFLAAWAVLGSWDSLNWNRARWEGGKKLVERGIAPSSICGGFEWHGVHNYEPMARAPAPGSGAPGAPYLGNKPFVDGRYSAFLAFAGASMASGIDKVGEVPYFSPLSFRTERIELWVDESGRHWPWRL
ncbi:MAG: glycosyltransferase family 39 protein [Elusimicrobia bacterium]|nr:glycosyltransferase family 39 protein [Elusimicrobiota bacterium]